MKNFIMVVASCTLSMFISTSYVQADDNENFVRMLKYAEQGDAEAGYHTGMMYQIGLGTTSDHRKAFQWFEKSAAAGDPLAEYKVGCYYSGQGTDLGIALNFEQAISHKLVAAKAGYNLAQMDVAKMYYSKGDMVQANLWREKALAQEQSPSELTRQAKLGKDRIIMYLAYLDTISKALKDNNQIQRSVNAR